MKEPKRSFSYVLALEEICKACASTGVIMSVNNSLVCEPILRFGTEEQKKKYLYPLANWEKEYKKLPKRDVKFTTVSGEDVPPLATPAELDGFDYLRGLGFPGSYPFTRGVYNDVSRKALDYAPVRRVCYA